MQVKQFVIKSTVFDEVSDYLQNAIKHDHIFRSVDTILFAGEDYSFMTNTDQFYYIAVRRDLTATFIEVNCGGSRESPFWGSEARCINAIGDKIVDYCEKNRLDFNENEVELY
jgi:hypothetical protein